MVTFSDTLAIGASLRAPAAAESQVRLALSGLLETVNLALAYVMRNCAKAETPLVFRGAVAVGKLVAQWDGSDPDGDDGNVMMVGPAVDEAAEYMNQPEGSFVVMTPSALEYVRPPGQQGESVPKYEILPYTVPIKLGRTFETYALSPFVDTGDPEEIRAIRDGHERVMSSSRVDVTIKRQHTRTFLDFAASEAPKVPALTVVGAVPKIEDS